MPPPTRNSQVNGRWATHPPASHSTGRSRVISRKSPVGFGIRSRILTHVAGSTGASGSSAPANSGLRAKTRYPV